MESMTLEKMAMKRYFKILGLSIALTVILSFMFILFGCECKDIDAAASSAATSSDLIPSP